LPQPIERHVVLPIGSEDEPGDGTTNSPDGLATISRLADQLLPTLIARLDASSLGELEVRRNGWRVRLRRHEPDNEQPHNAPGARQLERRPEKPSEASTAAEAGQRSEAKQGVVTAPAVGYYLPHDKVTVGASVRGGDLLGHVDVLGVRVEVVSPSDGRLTRVLAEPGEAVEYGQPLARLEAESRA
jgi:acetyl-CoA carboxylase biotin carboxyl carrier protein